MWLEALTITSIRNIRQTALSFSPRFNVVCGPNGSGKSSLLEAIYLLGYGRSFRTHVARPMIQDGTEKSIVYAEFNNKKQRFAVGIERLRQGGMTIRKAGQAISSVSALASEIPVLLISPDSYKILEEGPKYRRQYLDWGVFHVEQNFLMVWQRYQRALKQRNAALRNRLAWREVCSWDEALVESAEHIHEMRQAYLEKLEPSVREVIAQLFNNSTIDLRYQRGWAEGANLMVLLNERAQEDRSLGYTSVGPHRADLQLKMDLGLAKNHLSRGQQKLLVCALIIAQAKHLSLTRAKQPLVLIDDLCSELDKKSLSAVLGVLNQLECQMFLTSIETESLNSVLSLSESAVFHVEHGCFKLEREQQSLSS